jgi:copper transport protein
MWKVAALVALIGGLLVAAGVPQEASAHAVLERSSPVQGQQLPEPPELVETWYSEPLERSLTTVEVLDTQGNAVHVGETIFSDDDPYYAAVALPADLVPGIYTATYENVSRVDGHTWSGFFTFIILEADGSVPAGEALIPGGLAGEQGYLPEHADTVLRWAGLLASAALGGALFFALVVARPAAEFLDAGRRRTVERAALGAAAGTVIAAAVVIAISTAVQLFLLADRLGGLDTFSEIVDTRSGRLALSRLGLSMAFAVVFLPFLGNEEIRGSRQGAMLLYPAVVGAGGLLMTYSLASHGAAEGGAFWAVAADFTHFCATAAWVGGLIQLALGFRWSRELDEPYRPLYLANALDRFSWLAVISVAVLLGTGVFNAFVQLPTREALWETTYGRVLIAKLTLIVPLLAVAAVNALYLKPRMVAAIDQLTNDDSRRDLRGSERARAEDAASGLRRALPVTTIAEVTLAAGVLIATSILAQTTTATGDLRAQATQSAEDFVVSAANDAVQVELTISPLTVGLSEYTAVLSPVQGDLGEVLGVRLIATFDDPGVAPSAGRQGTSQELAPTMMPEVWSAQAALLTQPGDWRIETRIQRRGEDDEVVRMSVPEVGGFLAREDEPQDLFDLPFTFTGWNVVAGGAMLALGVGVFLIWHNRPPTWRRSTSASVGVGGALALVAGAVLLFGVDSHEPGVLKTSPVEATEASLARGQELFERNCIACHGPTGEGDGPAAEGLDVRPPRMSDHVPFHSDGVIFTWITQGIPPDEAEKDMPAFEDVFSEEDRWHLVNFLRATFDLESFDPVLPEDLQTPEPGGSDTPNASQ